MTTHYTVTPEQPEAHLFTVQCTLSKPHPDGQTFRFPAWTPGSYKIRDFARHVVSIKAEANGQHVVLEKVDKSTWYCSPCTGELTLIYQVYAWDLSVRGAYLDTVWGFFNGPAVLIEAVDQPGLCTIRLQPPAGKRYNAWRLATALSEGSGTKRYAFGDYQADNYAELIDHPVLMGELNLIEFTACQVPHTMAIVGRHAVDAKRFAADLSQLCEHHIRFFGEPAPFSRYLFLLTVLGNGYGGLEHRASSALHASRDTLPQHKETEISTGYRQLLGLCSHEYFHSWNIKRMKPAVFTPYQLQEESYTQLMWVFEGITSYYDDLALLHSGLIDRASYLQLLQETINRVLSRPGRFKQTVAESSFDAWSKFYQQDENAPNSIVSYYGKGALIALALDLTLREKSAGKCTLKHIMRELWQRYGADNSPGLAEQAFEALVSEVIGEPMAAFFEQTVRSTEDLPLADLMQRHGVLLSTEPEKNTTEPKVSLGVIAQAHAQGVLIQSVLTGAAALQAGLAAGDIIVAIDALKICYEQLPQRLIHYQVGDTIQVHAFRRDELMEFTLKLQLAYQAVRLNVNEAASSEEKTNLNHWL